MKILAFLITICMFCADAVGAAQSQSAPPGGGSQRPTKDVLITWDLYGSPHIYASTDTGAFFGAGYAAARDRLFQMHYYRLIYQGRVAEFFGAGPNSGTPGNPKFQHVEHDKRMRYFGWSRHAQRTANNLGMELRELLQAYADGVNAYKVEPNAVLHPFFQQYGIPLEDWTVADCIGVWNYFGSNFANDGLSESESQHDFEELLQTMSQQEAIDEFLGTVICDDAAAVVQQSDVPAAVQQAMQDYANLHGLNNSANCTLVVSVPEFSHAWAVSGQKTSSGHSILTADPRIPIFVPNMLMEWSMEGQSFRARGMGIPGSPNMLVGSTPFNSWGVTAMGYDQADLFELVVDGIAHPGEYFLDGAWRPFEIEEQETIKVHQGTDATITYVETVWGPEVTALAEDVGARERFCVKRVPLYSDLVDSSDGFLSMYRATNQQEFGDALGGWEFPSVNVVYASADDGQDGIGGIAYWANGAMPTRNPNVALAGMIAVDGSQTANDWIEIMPHDVLPWVKNPAQGYLLSANHIPVGSWYPLPIRFGTLSHGDTTRSRRLRERLEALPFFSSQDVLDIHYDTVNPDRRDFVIVGLHLRDVQTSWNLSVAAQAALTQLEGWLQAGATMDNQHPATALAAFINTNFRLPTAGTLVNLYGGGQSGLSLFFKTTLDEISQGTELPNETAFYVDKTLADAYNSILNSVGPPSVWSAWYEQNVLQVELEKWTNLTEFPSLEPGVTVPVNVVTADGNTILSALGQTYTQHVVMQDGVLAQSILPLGQSEHEALHFLDQQPLFETPTLKNAPLSLKEVIQTGLTGAVFKKY